ncbi:ATP-binding cassette domain-containing protein [Chitinimonas sp.]|uniref:ABC transporter ATP-binding protein n=1 Tax=Chitinimonas sp. TaxID=1934313 RepID=UPI0035ADF057
MSDYIIDVAGLTKRFGDKTVVDGLNMQVNRGEIYGFLGPNGSGKTTSIRMMCGLLTPDAGQGQTLGYDVVRQAASIKREVGYMTQRFGLYDDLSIRENLDFVARVYGMDRRRQRVDAALQRLGLEGRQKQLAGSLSGGWKQRLALAACMLHEPRLLLLDEPTAGVDPKARRDFWDEIHTLAHEGITVLVSTHYMDEAERCHRLGYIAYGKLLAMGTPAELVAQSPLSTWTIAGTGASALGTTLEQHPGVEMVTRFGNALHVSGVDSAELAAAIAPYRDTPGLSFEHGRPALEDVFIHLMRQSADNFR